MDERDARLPDPLTEQLRVRSEVRGRADPAPHQSSTLREHAHCVVELLRRYIAVQRVERREVTVDGRGEELLGRRLFERAPQSLAEWWFDDAGRHGAAEICKAAEAEGLRGADHGGVARAEPLGEGGRREQRLFGTELQQALGDPAFGRRELVATGQSFFELAGSICYLRLHSRSIRYDSIVRRPREADGAHIPAVRGGLSGVRGRDGRSVDHRARG